VKLESEIAALGKSAPDKIGAGVEDPMKAAGVEEAYDPSNNEVEVEEPMIDSGEDVKKDPSKDLGIAPFE
jgi:hypothetical protein